MCMREGPQRRQVPPLQGRQPQCLLVVRELFLTASRLVTRRTTLSPGQIIGMLKSVLGTSELEEAPAGLGQIGTQSLALEEAIAVVRWRSELSRCTFPAGVATCSRHGHD
jgi:hypothetical protein